MPATSLAGAAIRVRQENREKPGESNGCQRLVGSLVVSVILCGYPDLPPQSGGVQRNNGDSALEVLVPADSSSEMLSLSELARVRAWAKRLNTDKAVTALCQRSENHPFTARGMPGVCVYWWWWCADMFMASINNNALTRSFPAEPTRRHDAEGHTGRAKHGFAAQLFWRGYSAGCLADLGC